MSGRKRVAIHGFGRTGRQAFKAIWNYYPDLLEVAAVGVKEPEDAPAAAHLLKFDSNYGRFGPKVLVVDHELHVGDSRLPIVVAPSPAQLPWRKLGVDIVIDATGAHVSDQLSRGHLEAGARKVVITAPSGDADFTLIYGVNDADYDPGEHDVVSTGSDTANALAVVCRALTRSFDVRGAIMTSVRAYTTTQKLLDRSDDDLRRARAAPQSIVPTGTTAAQAVVGVCPEVSGRLDGYAVRVPVPTVSILELTAHLADPASPETIVSAFREAAEGALGKVLSVSDEPLVSRDFVGDRHSAVLDAPSTLAIGPLAKLAAWYDNEWGYSSRVADAAALLAEKC